MIFLQKNQVARRFSMIVFSKEKEEEECIKKLQAGEFSGKDLYELQNLSVELAEHVWDEFSGAKETKQYYMSVSVMWRSFL